MLLWGARVGMFIGYAWVGLLAVSSGVQLFRRRWRAGLLRLLGVVVMAGFGLAVMSALGLAYANSQYRPALGDVTVKARLLGTAIATQMNWALGGLVFGTVIAVLLHLRRRRQPGHDDAGAGDPAA